MILEVKDLCVEFDGMRGKVQALKHINFSINNGEILGVVGESGSGKSVTALSIIGLLEKNAKVSNGEIYYLGKDILNLPKKERQALRGKKISMVFQEPMTALHPTMKIGTQLREVIQLHRDVSKKEAHSLVIQALKDVHINEPELVARKYPNELSGGMRQRIVIALAMASPPDLLIADEPTTALDVTIQYEILNLIQDLNRTRGTAVLFITHDLGVVSQICHRTIVMYCGEIVEEGKTKDILHTPAHPYTQALLHALPDIADRDKPLEVITGQMPSTPFAGCTFASRCNMAMNICKVKSPTLEKYTTEHSVSCWLGR